MINNKHLLKVTAAWVSIVYIICYAGVAIYPPSRELFVRFALHGKISLVSDYFGLVYFFSGLVIWNIVTMLGVLLFTCLFNKIKKD